MYFNRFLCLFILLLIHLSIYAQKGMYIGLTAGYGFSIGGSTNVDVTRNYQSTSPNSPQYTYIYKNNPLNVGHGFVPSFLVGYFFNKNIGAELGIGYLIGAKYVTNYIYQYTYFINGNAISNSTSNPTTYKFNSLLFNPTLIFKIPKGSWSPYLKLGLLFGVANELTRFSEYDNSGYYIETNTGGLTFGFSSAAGLEVFLNKRWGVFGEIVFRYANYSPGKYSSKLLLNNSNGASLFDFSMSGNYTDNLNTANSPSSFIQINSAYPDRSIVNYSANSLGGTIGVRYYLNVEKVSSK